MALLAPDVGEVLLLKYMLNNVTPDDPIMKLYTNERTPAESDVLAGYTEATDVAYTNVVLAGASWTVSTGGGTTTGTFAEQQFSFSGSASVYGYFVTNVDGGSLLFSERFTGAPFNIPSGGGTIAVTPNVTLD